MSMDGAQNIHSEKLEQKKPSTAEQFNGLVMEDEDYYVNMSLVKENSNIQISSENKTSNGNSSQDHVRLTSAKQYTKLTWKDEEEQGQKKLATTGQYSQLRFGHGKQNTTVAISAANNMETVLGKTNCNRQISIKDKTGDRNTGHYTQLVFGDEKQKKTVAILAAETPPASVKGSKVTKEHDYSRSWKIISAILLVVAVVCACLVIVFALTEEFENKNPNKEGKACHDAGLNQSDMCYFFSEHKTDWSAAKKYCIEKNAVLAEPDTTKKINYLKYAVIRDDTEIRRYTYWIGGTKGNNESEWIWSSSRKSIIETDWRSPLPSNHNGKNCMTMHKSFNYKWNYAKCSKTYRFICEKT